MLLIHGDDQVRSRQRLTAVTRAFKDEIVRFGDKVELTTVKQALESQSLFGDERLVIIEGWPNKEVFDYGKNFKNLIIWAGKTIDGRKLNSLARTQIEIYKINPAIFAFLDTLKTDTFHQALKQSPVEKIFFMLARRIRHLMIIKDLGYEGLSEVSPFEKSKIAFQSKKYQPEQLTDFYAKLLPIEYAVKSGQSTAPLTLQLEVLLASL
ncbi:MAG: hypothetical protein ABH807_00965 [Candidatus Shapirobacteria bacterium]